MSPWDEHGNEANGVCMNCGAAMAENPMSPWCADCTPAEIDCCGSARATGGAYHASACPEAEQA